MADVARNVRRLDSGQQDYAYFVEELLLIFVEQLAERDRLTSNASASSRDSFACPVPVPDDQLTVGELIERFLSDVAPDRVSPSTLDNYRRIAKHHLFPTLGRKKLAQLTLAEVQALLRAKIEAGYSPRTVRLIRGLLVQCINQAERWGIVARNVARLTDGPKLARSEGRTLSPLQARELLEAARGDRLEACYVVLLALGMRKGEALGIAWTDVDLDKGLLTVRQALKRVGGAIMLGEVKTAGSRRTINLPEEVVGVLRSHRARQAAERLAAGPSWSESGLVFTTPVGTPIDPSNFRRQFDKVCAKAGLVGWHPHELRHSAASIMLAAGVPLEVVSRVLGHASIRITADVYGHIMDRSFVRPPGRRVSSNESVASRLRAMSLFAPRLPRDSKTATRRLSESSKTAHGACGRKTDATIRGGVATRTAHHRLPQGSTVTGIVPVASHWPSIVDSSPSSAT